VIQVRQLTKRYGATAAVDQLSFDVRPGLDIAMAAGLGATAWLATQRDRWLAVPVSFRRGPGPLRHDACCREIHSNPSSRTGAWFYR
jgi:hypothetical protein